MIYKVEDAVAQVDFAPEGVAEILQNVRTILSTAKGSVPLFREFGVEVDNLDAPINLVTAKVTAEVAAQIAAFEPRCKLKKLEATANVDGTLNFTARVEIL